MRKNPKFLRPYAAAILKISRSKFSSFFLMASVYFLGTHPIIWFYGFGDFLRMSFVTGLSALYLISAFISFNLFAVHQSFRLRTAYLYRKQKNIIIMGFAWIAISTLMIVFGITNY